jgi:hypothetical protein
MIQNSIGLFFTTAFLTRKHKMRLLLILFCLFPIPSIAATRVDLSPRTPENGLITVRAKVLADGNVPIDSLKKEDFRLYTSKIGANQNLQEIKRVKLIQPDEQIKIDPARIVILLDMSGSMIRQDASGIKKLDGAISAIRGFISLVRKENIPAKIAIVPFGEGKLEKCNYNVNQETIKSKYLEASNQQIDEQITQLARTNPCAATNLFGPLKEAVTFLGEDNISQDIQENSIQPRLSVILFSDGFHNTKNDTFESLAPVFQKYPLVKVNTLGYGEPLKNLKNRTTDCQGITDEQLEQINITYILSRCKIPGDTIEGFIVDQPGLKEIARLTSGISEFPNDAKSAVNSLETFFKSLREYEFQFRQPGADEGEKYQVMVEVDVPSRQIKSQSALQDFVIPTFGYQKLPLFPDRLAILAGTLAALAGSVLVFRNWSRKLREESDRFL